MEDRITPGLYLEMTGADPGSYAEKRVDEMLRLPEVQRATWWENQKPDRKEFPRRLPEFRTLGVYEVGAGFRAPAGGSAVGAAEITGHHFRLTPRPGQGTLSGKPTLGLELVLISPKTPKGAQTLRDWADFIHLRHIAAANAPGFTMITPYENASGGSPRYMHFYEMDTADAEEAFQGMEPATRRIVGEQGSPGWKEWAVCDELVIEYVNTFSRIGERSP